MLSNGVESVSEAGERVGRIRKGRFGGAWTSVPNRLINHPEMSIEARGLMIYLLSRPEDWELRTADVRRFLGTGNKPCGRNKAYEIIAELKAQRYIVMCENVGDGQHFAGVSYYVFPEPHPDPEEVKRRHRCGEDPLEYFPSTSRPENQHTGVLPRPDFRDAEKGDATKERYIINKNSPLTPQQRQRRVRRGFGDEGRSLLQPTNQIAEPWSQAWTEYRLRLLSHGMEKAPCAPTKLIQALIEKGGEAGERARRDHQAKNCYPKVKMMDDRAQNDGVGVLVPLDLMLPDLDARYHSVSVDSAEFDEWQDAHRARGWPLFPKPSVARNVWLPVTGVAALGVPNEQRRKIA